MDFRIACGTDAEIISAFLNLADQFHGMAVSPGRRIGLLKLRSQVASKRHDIFQSHGVNFLDFFLYHFSGRGNTGQMRKRRNLMHVLDILCNIQRIAAGSAAGTVGYAHKCRVICCDFLCSRLHGFKAALLFRRKYLKRE